MRILITVFVFLAAVSMSAGTITSVVPNSVTVGSGEYFVNINGTGLGDTVSWSGPAGSFTVPINARTNAGVIAWVPVEIVNTPGSHSIVVLGGTGNTAPFPFSVVDPNKLKLQIVIPELIAMRAPTPRGEFVKYDVSAFGGDDPSPVIDCSPASGSLFPLGATTVKCTATDRFGGRATGDFPVNVFDGGNPIVSVPKSFSVDATDSRGAVVKYDATATDDIDGALTPSCSPASGSLFPVGTTTVTCTSTDRALNVGGGSFDVKVLFSKLVINVPASVLAEAEDSKGARVSFDVTAASPTDPNPVIKCDTPSGSFFTLGTTIVSCTAFDRSGATASDRFGVTVADSIGPIVSNIFTKPDWFQPNGLMNSVSVVVDAFDVTDPSPKCSITGVTANENIDGDWRITGDLSVDLFGATKTGSRVYAVAVRCTDATGNPTDANANVTVSDKQPPPPTLTTTTAPTPAPRRRP
ncbi:MAG TPA: HYR domain-containing protein [Thermoanaerobaculia bacterium]|nr:HYR domain-containing protein [Thermoanaerobaculia bacterium]